MRETECTWVNLSLESSQAKCYSCDSFSVLVGCHTMVKQEDGRYIYKAGVDNTTVLCKSSDRHYQKIRKWIEIAKPNNINVNTVSLCTLYSCLWHCWHADLQIAAFDCLICFTIGVLQTFLSLDSPVLLKEAYTIWAERPLF